MLRQNRDSMLRLWLCGVVICLVGAAPARAQRINLYPSWRSMANRYEKAQAQEREQMCESCRQQLATAQEVIESGQTKRQELTTALGSARSQNEAARKQETAAKKRLQSARNAVEEADQAVFDRQAADSEYVRAQKELEQARDELDRVILKTLELPARQTAIEERDRQTERARFTSAQKAKLRGSAEYATANERVSAATSKLNRIKADLLAKDPEHKSATENVAAAQQAIDEATAAAKAAGMELSRVRKELKDCDATLASARESADECTEFLTSMGVPLQSTKKKKK